MGHAIDDIIDRLREGDDVRVGRFADVGPKLTDALRRVQRVHAKGGAIVDRKGRKSTNANDLVAMMIDDMPKLRKGLTHKQAVENARKRGRTRKERTPVEVALIPWTDLDIRTNRAALRDPRMKGWSEQMAYRELKASGRPTNKGPRKSKRKSR